jgi:CheY-like chemotaxis protein
MATKRDEADVNRVPRKRSGVAEKAVDVIVVEDDADSREMMATLLTANECLVRAVATADAAHDAALERVPDVVVTDLRLVGGSAGWTLAEALRGEPRTKHVALIAVTGEVEPRQAVVAHFDAYLRKPIETTLLIELVKQLAALGRAERRKAFAAG